MTTILMLAVFAAALLGVTVYAAGKSETSRVAVKVRAQRDVKTKSVLHNFR